jgi:hypothetical protein
MAGVNKQKGIGESTSITIPRKFTNYLTGGTEIVSQQHLELINEAIMKRQFIHLVMTGIAIIEDQKAKNGTLHVAEKVEEIQEKLDEVALVVNRMEDVLRGTLAIERLFKKVDL